MLTLDDEQKTMLHAYADWALCVSRCKSPAKLPRQPKGGTPLLVQLLGPGELFKLSFAEQAALCDRLAPGRASTPRAPSAAAIKLHKVTAERDALIASLTRLADAYDSLLAAHGKPHGWGLIESQVARETIAKVEKP